MKLLKSLALATVLVTSTLVASTSAGAAPSAAPVATPAVKSAAVSAAEPISWTPQECLDIANLGRLCIDKSGDGTRARGRFLNTTNSPVTGRGFFQSLGGDVINCAIATTAEDTRSQCVERVGAGNWRVGYNENGSRPPEFVPAGGRYIRFG